MNPGMRAGLVASLVGALLIAVGVFGFTSSCARPDVPCPSPSMNEVAAYLGLVVLVVGVLLLLRSGWSGSPASWVLASAAVIPATWFVYELARQGVCPLLSDPALSRACLTAYGEMTAPLLSFGVGGLVLAVGWVRWRRARAARDVREADGGRTGGRS